MRNTKATSGFTLIELLIVIAIIGILAAVLIPNLMNARTSAAQRAAQAHSSNVYTVAVAALADNPRLTATELLEHDNTDLEDDKCDKAGDIFEYSFNDAPGGVTCTIEADEDSDSDFVVTTVHTSSELKFINGVEQDDD